ncbi:MAG: tRNA 2-thiouridine(34) synthase MnmA [Oscillibacter sp.]|jgi:tRNA-specific 2-thiouridylase|nr:tRNA 2-thiouridine(34) synthase MnmA [Oscillibacter sp.]
MEKAMIAMSGGVDSSVAAYLAREMGFSCIGVTLRLYDNQDAGYARSRTCCSLDDVEDARSVAFRLGIRYCVFNFTEPFRAGVLRPFVEDYARGETPNPCAACNRLIKFGGLLRRARELGCGKLVTGHYARIQQEDGRFVLKKAADPGKDQSYFLYSLTQEQLARILFPLGGLRKAETRRIAEEQGLVTARKRDSQDICFAPDGDYAGAVERCLQRTFPPGPFVDGAGRVLGEHRGIIRYTVGQRRGLGLSGPRRLYVRALRPEDNAVVLGEERELYARALEARDFNWISGRAPAGPVRVCARLRSCQAEQPAEAEVIGPDRVRIVFDRPQRAIAPGQAVVLYDGDTVVGGGRICRELRSDPPEGYNR